MFFWTSLSFLRSSGSWQLDFWFLCLLNLTWTSGSSQFMYCLSLAWRILIITLLACEMSEFVWQFENSLVVSFFEIRIKTDLYQTCGHCWVFQICLHIECNTLTASSFRNWSRSVGITTPPLALFVVMLPKAHLHSRMSGPWWVITPSWLFWSLRSFS